MNGMVSPIVSHMMPPINGPITLPNRSIHIFKLNIFPLCFIDIRLIIAWIRYTFDSAAMYKKIRITAKSKAEKA